MKSQRWLIALTILAFTAGVVWAQFTTFDTTLHYVFKNGITVEGICTGCGGRAGTGPFPPATCIAGDLWIDTDETNDTNLTTVADNSLGLCVVANTWVALENN